MKEIIQTIYKKKERLTGIFEFNKIESKEVNNEKISSYRIKCEAGFGHTIGLAVRRTVLSATEGIAVVALSVNDATHLFTNLSGVKESVMDIYMNFKKVVFKAKEDDFEYCVLSINKESGPEGLIITANDFEKSNLIEIVTKDAFICTLDNGGKLDLKIMIAKGTGYISFEEHNFSPFLQEGFLAVDTYFGSVLNCGYNVEHDTAGQNGFDIVDLHITTNGSLSPDDVIKKAGTKIFKTFASFENDNFNVSKIEESSSLEEEEDPLLETKILDLEELSIRSKNCLATHQIETVKDLIEVSESVLLSLDGFGNKSLNEIKEFLSNNGLQLSTKLFNNKRKK